MLSLVLPTYNEAQNLPELLPKIEEILQTVPHEIIVVDDNSPDRTWAVAQELSERCNNMHVIRRIGRRGLASAVIEGFLAAKGDVLAVADADGQHDLGVLPTMYAEVKEGGANIAIGSRYAEGGTVGEWDERRQVLSKFATALALRLCKVKVHDPMSGYFVIDRKTFEGVLSTLNPKGFKILLDLLVHVPSSTEVREIPITFGQRLYGTSKLTSRVQIEFLEYLYDVTAGRMIPLTFVKYCAVGLLGVLVHLGAYTAISQFFVQAGGMTHVEFSVSVLGAIEIAIIFNFVLNNVWTFAQQRLRGFAALTGFFKFNVACAFGALANYAVAALLFQRGFDDLLCVFVGAMVGVCWNYTMNRLITWRS